MRSSPRTASLSNRLTLILAATSAVAVFLPSAAHAQTTVSWVGTTGNYVDPTQWSSTSVPTVAGDIDAVINNTGTALLSAGDSGEAAILVLGLQPGDSGNLSMADGTLNLGDLNVAGRSLLFDNATPNGGGTGTFTQNGGTVNVTATASPSAIPTQSLYIANGSLTTGNSATGSYVMTAGQLNVGIPTSGTMIVGSGPGSSGSFTQSGGSVTLAGTAASANGIGTLQIGNGGSTGSYSLSNSASLSVNNGLNVGGGTGSTGIFTQSGGTLTNNYNMNIGFAGATGTYALSAGSFTTTGFVNVGSSSTTSFGTFIQSGGSASIGTTLNVGNTSATGSYSLTAGSLTAGSAAIGSGASSFGTFTQSNSSSTITGNLTIGIGGGTGSYTLSSGTLNVGTATSSPKNNFAIGNGVGSVGSFTITGGTLTTVGSDLLIGGAGFPGGTATFSQSGTASVSVGNNINIAYSTSTGAASGTYNIDGGTLNLTAPAAIFAVGNGPGDTAAVNQTAGTVTETGATSLMDLGRFGATGIYTLSGTGQLTLNKLLFNATASTAPHKFLLQNGSLNVTTVDWGATAATNERSLIVTGGTATIGTITNLGNTGLLNISSGTVNIGTITQTTATSVINLSGTANVSIGTIASAATGFKLIDSGDRTLNTNFPVLGTITFEVDAGTLALTGALGSPGRTVTKSGTGTLTISGTQTYSAAMVFTTSAGTLNLNSNIPTAVTINANVGTTNFGVSQSLTSLKVLANATAAVPANGSLILTSPALTLTGVLDLANNTLNYSQTGTTQLNTIRTFLSHGYNSGAWNGTSGILSTYAQSNPGRGLSYRDTGSLITVTTARMGDINFDGVINADDYALLDRNFAKGTFATGSAAHWSDGDFNYDGLVTSADYALIDKSLALQSGGLDPSFLAQREAEFGDAYVTQLLTAIPEPGTLSLVAATLTALSARRRRPIA